MDMLLMLSRAVRRYLPPQLLVLHTAVPHVVLHVGMYVVLLPMHT